MVMMMIVLTVLTVLVVLITMSTMAPTKLSMMVITDYTQPHLCRHSLYAGAHRHLLFFVDQSA